MLREFSVSSVKIFQVWLVVVALLNDPTVGNEMQLSEDYRERNLIATPTPMNILSSITLSDLDGSNGFVLNGQTAGDDSGYSVSGGFDFNNDGFDDVIIGAPNALDNTGETFIVFGSSNIGNSGVLELGNLDGSNGFVISGITSGDHCGFSVSNAGDFNNDGYSDVIIGAEDADNLNGNIGAGQSYIVYGGLEVGESGSFNLTSLNGINGFIIYGIDTNDHSGHAVSNAGDVNGDGIDDVIIGANFADPNGVNSAGESYVIYGTSTSSATSSNNGSFYLASLDGSNGFVINGVSNGDQSGHSLASAGDVNGDGYDDILIGANYADPNGQTFAGSTYLVLGSSHIDGGSFDLSSLNGSSNGCVFNGYDDVDFSGYSVSGGFDFNGDSYDDLIIGSPLADPNNNTYGGKSYIIFGAIDIGFNGSFDLSQVDGSNGFVINGIAGSDNMGYSVSGASDVNHDRYDDIIVGARTAGGSGASYVLYGGLTVGDSGSFDLQTLNGSNGFVMYGIDNSDYCGESVSGVGDFNGDGYDDMIIGAHGADPNSDTGAGESYIVFGVATNTPFPTLSPGPTETPTSVPSRVPSPQPTMKPTLSPSPIPSISPTNTPSPLPTVAPTQVPTLFPSSQPTPAPTLSPSTIPSPVPSYSPTPVPTTIPSVSPTPFPTPLPTYQPTILPTVTPTPVPTSLPTPLPSTLPTLPPTIAPTTIPTIIPSPSPTTTPTIIPTILPSSLPTVLPSSIPTSVPTSIPTITPTPSPTIFPSPVPSTNPEYTTYSLQAASTTFIAVACFQLLFCAGLLFKYSKNNIKKRTARGDTAAHKEQSKFGESHLIDLFGVKASHYNSKERNYIHQHQHDTDSVGFTNSMTDHMFTALDLDGDGRISKRDVLRWVSIQTKTGNFKKTISKIELNCFLQGGRKQDDVSENKKGLTREELKTCLNRFPMLAFDWRNPLSITSEQSIQQSTQQSNGGHMVAVGFSRDLCFEMFRRMDTDSDGFVKALDVRVWRKMLPIGRSEEKLVIALMTRASKVNHSSSLLTPLNEDDVGIKPMDLFITLSDDRALAVEVITQYSLLCYIYDGPDSQDLTTTNKKTDNKVGFDQVLKKDLLSLDNSPVAKFRLDDIGPLNTIPLNQYGNVPSDNAIYAFICISKLKLCRYASAQYEVDTHEETVVGDIFKILASQKDRRRNKKSNNITTTSSSLSSYVTCTKVQKFLHNNVGLVNLTREDLALILGDMALVDQVADIEHVVINAHKGSSKRSKSGNDGDVKMNSKTRDAHEKKFDHTALRQVFSRSAHHHLATLLHSFINITHKLASNKLIKNTDVMLYDKHTGERIVNINPFIGMEPTCILTKEEVKQLFTQIESSVNITSGSGNRDSSGGYINARHVYEWVKAGEGSHLISCKDIESLFHRALPYFHHECTVSPHIARTPPHNGDKSSVHMNSVGDVGGSINEEYMVGDIDESHAEMMEQVTSTLNSPFLDVESFTLSMMRRPYLSNRLKLMMKQFKAIEACLYAEFVIGAAAAAITALETAKLKVETDSTRVDYQITYELANKKAIELTQIAKNATTAVNIRLGGGSGGNSHEVKELEILIIDAITVNPYGQIAIQLREQLKEVRTRGMRHELAILFIEVGLNMRILELKEEYLYPIQTKILNTLPPLKHGSIFDGNNEKGFHILLPKISLKEKSQVVKSANVDDDIYMTARSVPRSEHNSDDDSECNSDRNSEHNSERNSERNSDGNSDDTHNDTQNEQGLKSDDISIEMTRQMSNELEKERSSAHYTFHQRKELSQEHGDTEEVVVKDIDEQEYVLTTAVKNKMKQLVKEPPVKVKELLAHIETPDTSSKVSGGGKVSEVRYSMPTYRLVKRGRSMDERKNAVTRRQSLPSSSTSPRSPPPSIRRQSSLSKSTKKETLPPPRRFAAQMSTDTNFIGTTSLSPNRRPTVKRQSSLIGTNSGPSRNKVLGRPIGGGKGMRRAQSVGASNMPVPKSSASLRRGGSKGRGSLKEGNKRLPANTKVPSLKETKEESVGIDGTVM